VQDIERRPSDPKGPLKGAEYPVLRITPEAGTVKTGKVRTIPIHIHLVEMGLLEYVAAVKARSGKQAPLFYRPPIRPSRNPRYRGPAVKVRENLAKWIRELGVDDPAVAPNHGGGIPSSAEQPERASSRGYGMRSAAIPPGHRPSVMSFQPLRIWQLP